MNRYFFHLHADIEAPDHEGQELAHDEAAMAIALFYARDLASVGVRDGHLDLDHRIVCAGEDGRTIGVVAFRDAVRVSGLPDTRPHNSR